MDTRASPIEGDGADQRHKTKAEDTYKETGETEPPNSEHRLSGLKSDPYTEYGEDEPECRREGSKPDTDGSGTAGREIE